MDMALIKKGKNQLLIDCGFFFNLKFFSFQWILFFTFARSISTKEFSEAWKYFFDSGITGNSSYRFLSIGMVMLIRTFMVGPLNSTDSCNPDPIWFWLLKHLRIKCDCGMGGSVVMWCPGQFGLW